MNPRSLRPFLFGLLFLFIVTALVFPMTGVNPFQTNAGAQTGNPRARNPAKPLPNYDAFAGAGRREGAGARGAVSNNAGPRVESGRPVQYEPRLGVPTFLWAPRQAAGNSSAARGPQQSAGGAASAAREHLGEFASLYRLSDAEVAAAKVAGVHDTGRGAVIVKLKQEIGGVEVFRDEINVVMNRDLHLVALSGYLTGDGAGAGLSAQDFRLQPAEALSKAVEDLTGTALSPSAFRGKSSEAASGEAANPYTLYTADGGAAHNFRFSEEPSRVKRVMFHLPDGYVPAYYVEAFVLVPSQDATTITLSGEPVMTELAYSYVISAVDGQLLFRNNLIDEDGEFTYRVWADPATKIPYDTPAGNGPHPKVVPLPDGAQAPFIPQSEVTLKSFPFSQNDPWLAPGATETNGNNVDAFVNLFSPDGIGSPTTTTPTDVPNGDHRAFITAPDAFLYTHQPDVDAFSADARQASITQLFYNINFLHDWFYDAGFDEASLNAQKDNYGRGGLGADDIKAQAQDFQSFNNANMLTPADGSRPRMRMYNFPNLANTLDVQSPAGIAGKLRIGVSQTGLRNFDVTGDIVIATFTAGPTTCTVTNAAALAGKIAMFDFDNTDGTGCAFSTRIARIHATGASAALMVYNSAPANANLVANITGINAAHTKPIGVITWNSAAPIKTQLAGANTVTARLLRLADRDGALDNQIVAHEWGHYISGRLIGNGSGLNNQQGGGMGEGWGDFLAMLLTVRPDDTATPSNATWGGPYALATYATSGVPFNGAANHGYYLGIRRTPYSTDMTSYNALTFKHIEDGAALPSGPPIASGGVNSEVHNTGEVWTTMLWECYAALLRDTQGATPRLSFSEAQKRMRQYLVAGLKMTPNSPTFLEARDAMLVAAFTYDYQDGLLFAQAFAKRGAGLNAVAPDRFSTDNSGVVESFEAGGALTFVGATLDDSLDNCDGDGYLDNTEKGLLKVTIKNAGFQNLYNTAATVASNNAHVTFPAGATINFAPTQPGETVTASIAVKVAGASGVETSDFTITFQDTGTPAVAPVAAHLFEYVNADESGPVTATDTVEPRQTPWAVTHEPTLLTDPSARWRRVGGSTGIDHEWFVADPGAASDQRLTSPLMTVDGSGSVNVQFDHSWAFEFDSSGNFDGGVVEMSVNGGAWTDVGGPAYNGTLVNYSGNLNPLKTRQAFVKSGSGHVSLTQAVAPGSTVRVRFRFGSDNAAGADGWRIDNIAFTGVAETPFRVLNPETDGCHVNPPATGVTIALSPEALPAATAGAPYTALVTPSGGTAPYTFNVTPAVLPAGLASSVVADGLQISGTPAHAGTSLVKVTATDTNSNQGSKTFTLTINKAGSTTTVTVANAAYDGNPHGGTAAATGFGGLNQSLTVTYAGRNGTTYGPSTTAPTNVGDYTAAAGFPGDADHNASNDSEDFSITKAGQAISFAALANKTFGIVPFAVSAAGGASGNPVTFGASGNCTSGGTNGGTITITGAGSCTVTASQAGNSNYNAATDVARTFTINKAAATITLGNLSHTYDGTAKAATATTGPSGLGAVTITYTLNSVPVAAPTDAGSYQVRASLSNADYQATDATDMLVIAKAGQTITFAALADKTFGDADFTVGATASSGLAVSLAGSGSCTVSGSTVHITGAGSCTVTASQAGDSNYKAAADVPRSFQVAKAGQTITFGALADRTFGDADFAVSATSASNLVVSFGATGACTVVGTNVHITGAGSCTVTASQAGDSNYNAAANAPQSFNIGKAGSTTTVTAPDATYDGNPHGGTAAATGFGGLNQSRPVTYAGRNGTTYGPSTTAPTNAGDYTASANFPGDTDHTGSGGSFDFRIAKAGQAITFAALANKTFGDADFTVSATAGSGFGVSFTASGQCTVSGATVHLTGAGACAVTASQAGDGNFNAAPNVERSFQIAKASQTVTFGSLADRAFGDADIPLSAAATSGLGVSFGATGACSVTGNSLHIAGAGSCTVTASQAGDSNYSPAADVQRSFTINKAGSTTTVTAPDATYDGNPHGGTAAATGFGGLSNNLTVTYTGRNGTVYGPSTTAPTNAGDYTAAAGFPGDADHNASSGSADFRIAKAGQAITFAALANKTFGDPDFDVSATAGPGFGVSFTASGQCTISGAVVHLTGAGSCTVTASQAGDNNNSAAPNVERSFQIAKGVTQTALSSSINPSDFGQHVTFTAAVTSAAGVPAGSVTFKDGAATLGTRTLDGAGVATFTTSALAAGVHTITAEYAGGSDHLAGTGTLLDGQTVKGAPTLTVGDVTITEGDGGTKDAVFTVSLSAASGLGVSVNFATSNGTATAPGDYEAANGTLSFGPGETTKTVTVKVKGDSQSESDETFTLSLSGHVNALIGGPGTGTIVNDDAAGGVLRFSAAEYGVAEGAGSVVITVERVGDTSAAASVEYATDDGGVPGVFVPCAATTGAALERCDFTAAAGRLDFAAGETSKTFSVLVTDDAYADGPEALSLVLGNPAGGAVLGGASTALLNITDNDITSSGNPLDITESFVRQHYHDFLNREPDTAGLQFWTNEINSCGTNAACVEAKRVNVSAAFFHSIEFQNTGYLVYRSNVAAFGPTRVGGLVPVTSAEFLPDVRQLARGVIVGAAGWEARLEANKQEYFREFVARPAFAVAFPSSLTPEGFVDALNANAGGPLSQPERDALVAELTANNNGGGRASVLRKVADDADLKAAHSNRAFVLMQYFGYLRRDPNASPDTNFDGYSFWLSKLDEFNGNYINAEMVKAFITSDEYRRRFGQ